MSDSTPPLPTRPRKPSGYWQVWDNLAQELTAFILEHGKPGQMPTKAALTQAGRSDLINAIRAFGGQEAVATRLGMANSQHPPGYWDDFSRVADAIRTFMAQHGVTGVMPGITQLQKYGPPGLRRAIHQHGGPAAVAVRLELLPAKQRHPDHYWNDFAMVRLALQAFCAEHGLVDKLPSKKTLTRYGRHDLTGAIQLHGGWRVVARKLGLAEAPA